ncbi:MAG: GNAT family N-acetyltransferase, partial [Gemmataceae bacterium]
MPSQVIQSSRCVSMISGEQWPESEVYRAWEDLAADSDPLGAVYRCPAWFDHIIATATDLPLHVAVVRDGADGVRGVAPLSIRRIPIELHAAGVSVAAAWIRVVDLFGGQPLVAEDPAVYDCLLSVLKEAFPKCDGIRLADIPSGGPLFQHLLHAPTVRSNFLVHVIDGLAPYQTLPLPESFAKYMSRFSRKKRYNLKRQERLLRDAGGGRLELRRWETLDDVPTFRERLAELRRRTKHAGPYECQAAGSHHGDLAARGLLRCYTLTCGEVSVAALIGYQYGTTYTVDTTLYDSAFARFSPGTTMMHLAIQDLLSHRPVNLIDFGYGKPTHDQQPPRVSRKYSKVLLLKKTLHSRVICAGTSAFHSSVRLVEGG